MMPPDSPVPTSSALTVYGHGACPMVLPVRVMLDESGVPYRYINIHRDPDAAARVREINQGNESVPTLVFADGTTLTEPTLGQLAPRLAELGYTTPSSRPGIAAALPYVLPIGGGLGGAALGALLGDAGAGLVIGTAAGFASSTLLIRRAGA